MTKGDPSSRNCCVVCWAAAARRTPLIDNPPARIDLYRDALQTDALLVYIFMNLRNIGIKLMQPIGESRAWPRACACLP